MKFAVDVQALFEVSAKLRELGPAIEETVATSVDRAVEAGVQAAQAGAPRRTGTLADSIEGHSSGTSGQVDATAPYAHYVYFGTAKMAPEPAFMDNAAIAAQKALVADADRAVDQAVARTLG